MLITEKNREERLEAQRKRRAQPQKKKDYEIQGKKEKNHKLHYLLILE